MTTVAMRDTDPGAGVAMRIIRLGQKIVSNFCPCCQHPTPGTQTLCCGEPPLTWVEHNVGCISDVPDAPDEYSTVSYDFQAPPIPINPSYVLLDRCAIDVFKDFTIETSFLMLDDNELNDTHILQQDNLTFKVVHGGSAGPGLIGQIGDNCDNTLTLILPAVESGMNYLLWQQAKLVWDYELLKLTMTYEDKYGETTETVEGFLDRSPRPCCAHRAMIGNEFEAFQGANLHCVQMFNS